MLTSFSHTAPRFTDEDRKREYNLLSEAERRKIDDDRNGTDTHTFGLQEEDSQDYVLQMEEELHTIPSADKEAYTQALIRCPDLVETESKPVKFLRKHDFNVAASAKNLIDYWAWRVKLFEEKAYLPMTLHGALQNDLDTLSTGFFQILPRDCHGRAVVYHEKRLANPKIHHRHSLLRVVFYIYHVMSSSEESQKKGFVLISNAGASRLRDVDRLYTKMASSLTVQVAPLKLKTVQSPTPDTWFLPKAMVEPVLMFVVPPQMRVRIRFFRLVEELEDCGISENDVPPWIGGSYDRKIEHWIEELRNQEERECFKDLQDT